MNRIARSIAGALALGALALTACSTQAPTPGKSVATAPIVEVAQVDASTTESWVGWHVVAASGGLVFSATPGGEYELTSDGAYAPTVSGVVPSDGRVILPMLFGTLSGGSEWAGDFLTIRVGTAEERISLHPWYTNGRPATDLPLRSAPTTEGPIGRVEVRANGDLYLLPHDNVSPVSIGSLSVEPLLGAVKFRDLKDELTDEDGELTTPSVTLRQGDLGQVVDIEVWS